MKREDLKVLPPEKVYTEENPKPMTNSLAQMLDLLHSYEQLIAVSAEQNEGEIDLALEEKLIETVERHIPNKIDAYGFILDAMKSRKEFFKAQKDMMDRAMTATDNVEKRLKGTIEHALQTLGTDEIFGNQWRFKSQQSPGSLEVFDQNLVPEIYKKPPVITVPVDTDKLKADLKMGLTVPGARLIFKNVIKKYANVTGKKRKHDDKRIDHDEAKAIAATSNSSDDGRTD